MFLKTKFIVQAHDHRAPVCFYHFNCANAFQFYRIPINYLLVNLAVAEIMYGIFIAPRVFYKLPFSHPDGKIGPGLCKFLTDGNVAWIGSAASFVTLVAIAFERYYSVIYPFGNKGEFTQRKLKVSSDVKLECTN